MRKNNLKARIAAWEDIKFASLIYTNSKKKNGGDGAKHTWHKPGSNKK